MGRSIEANFNIGREIESSDQELWQSNEMRVVIPEKTAIPQSEGLHIEVESKKVLQPHWLEEDAAEQLRMGYYSLPVAKVLAEGRQTPDFWANIHFNARPGFDRSINVFGRSPESEEAWGKPVKIRSAGVSEKLPDDTKENLEETFERYMTLWRKNKDNIKVFEDGVEPLDPESDEYREEVEFYGTKDDPWKEDVLWANKKFVLVNVRNPHLTGTHLVVHPRQKYWQGKEGFKRAWQVNPGESANEHIKGFLESMAILLATEKILAEQKGLKFNNPEIHFSGNWAKDLKTVEQGGKVSMRYLEGDKARAMKEKEKASHKPGRPGEFQTAFHGHLYATRDPDQYVDLPSRPAGEVPEEWQGISRSAAGETDLVKTALENNLNKALDDNYRVNL